MTLKELRIENFIYSNGLNEVVKVHAAILMATNDTLNALYDPIILTESWLLKFGFTTEYPTLKDKFFTIKNSFNINSFNFGTGFKLNTSGCFEYKSIKYVHQLQNIYFDLTGNELILI